MGLFGCVDLDSAYRSINWKSLILIVGMMPFSVALQRTGGVQLAANAMVTLIGETGPVTVALAADLDASPYRFAMIVALASSTAFMTPTSSPVNTLVAGPGNYASADFVRIGTPLSLIVLVLSVLLVP
jgi:di/tricarboxylate transporter